MQKTITGLVYLDMLELFVFPQLDDIEQQTGQRIIFMQDGAPPHYHREVNYDSGGRPPRAPKRDKERVVEKKKSSRELRKSKENLIDYEETRRGSSDSLDQSQKRSRGNLVFVGRREPRDEVDNTTMTMGRTHKTSDRSSEKSRDLGRSLSIPKDNRVSSGWFKGKTSRAK
ncbi:hypothetical protein J6590_058199 [Homalodisca vitripennis]|nr:hypothetical protein J6590_058199 [Homalodisca vitripennis]